MMFLLRLTEAGTAATATNGFTLKANTSTLITPDTKPTMGLWRSITRWNR